ncbi:hypothetical protein SUGI_0933290 [Cryptomeria japonica]|nr:hypothetical protein SUGI_0933290 [Cryptomeria japonica]
MGIQHASRLEFKKGDRHGMVAEIKVYLQRLGYNAIAGAEAEKENGLFDERLEAAGFLESPKVQSRRRTRTPESASPDKIKTVESDCSAEQVEQQQKQPYLRHLLHNLLTHSVRPRHPVGDCCDIRQFGDGDEWVFEFVEGEHGDEDTKMKFDFLRRFLTEDDAAATLYGDPPPGPGPPLPCCPNLVPILLSIFLS